MPPFGVTWYHGVPWDNSSSRHFIEQVPSKVELAIFAVLTYRNVGRNYVVVRGLWRLKKGSEELETLPPETLEIGRLGFRMEVGGCSSRYQKWGAWCVGQWRRRWRLWRRGKPASLSSRMDCVCWEFTQFSWRTISFMCFSTWFKRPPNWSTRTDLTDCTYVTTADQKRSARAQISVECGLVIGPTLCGLVQKWFRFCFTNLIYIKFRIIDKFEMERIIFPLSLVPISHIFQLNLIVRKYWLINNRTKFSYKISCS